MEKLITLLKRPPLSLTQFKASRKFCSDLGRVLPGCDLTDHTGYVYHGNLYIESKPVGDWPNGRPERYHLIITNQEWLSDDLDRLEALLYEFALADGHLS